MREQSLEAEFPDLNVICTYPDITIEEMWIAQGWNLIFRRLLNDCEGERVAELLGSVENFSMTTTGPHTIR